jgi:hypothetical protein
LRFEISAVGGDGVRFEIPSLTCGRSLEIPPPRGDGLRFEISAVGGDGVRFEISAVGGEASYLLASSSSAWA